MKEKVKLLMVIDYQNDFVDGALGFPKAKELEEGIFNKIKSYEDSDIDCIMFTYDTHEDNYLETREGKNLPIPHCIKNTQGHRLYGKLKNYAEQDIGDHVFKTSFGLGIEELKELNELNELEDYELTTIEIVGVVTNICVLSVAVQMQNLFPNAEIVVDASLCASFDEDLHNKTLDVLEGLQMKVINRKVED